MNTPELKPANENPWYILMTLYGEQDGDEVDWELHKKNRAVWNAWSCQNLSDDERAKLEGDGVALPEVGAWEAIEEDAVLRHSREFLKRNGEGVKYSGFPAPENTLELFDTDFSSKVILARMIFCNSVNFSFASFRFPVSYREAVFSQKAIFEYVTFRSAVDFRKTSFHSDAGFSTSNFASDANFVDATFFQDANFKHTRFAGNGSFSGVEFERSARYAAASFEKVADFAFANFKGDASFEMATFKAEMSFNSATFAASSEFVSIRVTGRADFIEVYFGDTTKPKPVLLDLTDAQFVEPVSFRRAVFANCYPDLKGAILNEHSQWPLSFDSWPLKSEQSPQQGRDSCAYLRHHMNKQGLPEAEIFFFMREMAFAKKIGNWPEQLPYKFYGLVSDYGHSITRPVNCLLVLFFIGAFAVELATEIGLVKSMGYSFANMFKFFGLQRTYFDFGVIQMWPAWLQWLSGAQTVLSFIFLFFLGLGLRTRFRLR